MESMYVPEPVLSVAMKPKHSKDQEAFSKAIARFQKQVNVAHL
jgi:elongation factor G